MLTSLLAKDYDFSRQIYIKVILLLFHDYLILKHLMPFSWTHFCGYFCERNISMVQS